MTEIDTLEGYLSQYKQNDIILNEIMKPLPMFGNIPEGKYNMLIEKCTYNEEYKSIEWTLRVLDGEFANIKIGPRTNITNEIGQKILVKNLSLLGVFDKSIPFKGMLQNCINLMCEAYIKVTPAKKEGQFWYNFYVNKLIQAAQLQLPQSLLPNKTPSFDKDSEIPF